jgi:hypothetical protein
MNDLKQGGELHNFLLAVIGDHTLCLEIRDDYVNIYYRGGNLFRIKANRGSYSVTFDPNYSTSNTHRTAIAQIQKQVGSGNFSPWIDNIPLLKSVMDQWFMKHPKSEREYQQLVLRENNFSSVVGDATDYFITDIEYADSKNHSRFDMIAVKWPSPIKGKRKDNKNLRLALIEVKYGDNALDGAAGLVKHIVDMNRFLSQPSALQDLCDEMSAIFNQKVNLGLIPKAPGEIDSIIVNKPEFILLLANHKPSTPKLIDTLKEIFEMEEYKSLCKKCDVRISLASHMGYGLYDECMLPLDQYRQYIQCVQNLRNDRGCSHREDDKETTHGMGDI